MADEQGYQDKLKRAADNMIKLGLAPRGTYDLRGHPGQLDQAELGTAINAVRRDMMQKGSLPQGASMDQFFAVLEKTAADVKGPDPADIRRENDRLAAADAKGVRTPSQADVRKADNEKAAAASAKGQAQNTSAPAHAEAKPTIPFKGEDMVLQAQLRLLGQADVGPVDGRKGPLTEAAMAAYAKKNGIDGKDETAIRAKIAEQYAALKMTPDKINGLVNSSDRNDVKAGQIAYNIQHPDAMLKVTGELDTATSSALAAGARARAAAIPQTTTSPAAPAQVPQQQQAQQPQYQQPQSQQPAAPQSPAAPQARTAYGQGLTQQGERGTTFSDGGAPGGYVPPQPQQPMTAQPPTGAQLQTYPQTPYVPGGAPGALSSHFTGQAGGGVMVTDPSTGISYNSYTGQYMNPNNGRVINPQDRNRDGTIDPNEYRVAVYNDNMRQAMEQRMAAMAQRPVLSPWTNGGGYQDVRERAYARSDGLMRERQVQTAYNNVGRGAGMVLDSNPRNNGQGLGMLLGAGLQLLNPLGQTDPRGPKF